MISPERAHAFPLLASLIFLFLGAAPVAANPLPSPVADELRRAGIPESALAVVVAPVDGGPAMISANAEVAMNPASTMKLVTTYTALEVLGPAYTWKTVIATSGTRAGDILAGDLYIHGAGDPKLMASDLWRMLGQLRGRGVRDIRGDVVLDHSLFEPVAYDPGQFDGEPFRPYNVGPDALLVNFKTVELTFVPDEEHKEVRVVALPLLDGQVIGGVKYLAGPCGDWKAKLGADFSDPAHLNFSGGFAGACGEKVVNVSVFNHSQYVGALFRSLWASLGGSFEGVVRDGVMPASARILVENESPSLAEIVRDINKYSNNTMAKELFLALPAEVMKVQANQDRAQRAIRTFLTGKGMPMPELVIENGSGLSRAERISAQDMSRVLLVAWGSAVMPEFVSSLSLVGSDGTMRRRLTGGLIVGQAHVKTGTLNDVRALAGYVLSVSGRRYVIVAFINHPNAGAAQGVQDALLRWTFDNG